MYDQAQPNDRVTYSNSGVPNRPGTSRIEAEAKMVKKVVGWSVGGLIALILLFGSFGTVGAGERGVKTRFNNVVGEVEPGLYMKIPFLESVHKTDIQTQKVQEDTTAASSDLQDVKATIAVNFNVDPNKVVPIFQTIGSDYQFVIIDPAIQETVKAVTAKYTAEQLVTSREKVREGIVDALSAKLGSQGFTVTQVAIVNFSFSDDFNRAIEAKVTAEQNALAAKNKLDQVKFEAAQRVAQATAEAEAIKIQASAIEQQGGTNYVSLQAIQKWDGHLPQQMIPGSSLPFINLTK